jgi:hypothetical protein
MISMNPTHKALEYQSEAGGRAVSGKSAQPPEVSKRGQRLKDPREKPLMML